jgi:hypothetical protein
MPCPERMRFTRKEIGKAKREGIIASVGSFGLDVLGIASGMAAGIGVGFSGIGGEIAVAGEVIGFLVLTLGGTYALVKSEDLRKKSASAFKRANEIISCAGKQTMAE